MPVRFTHQGCKVETTFIIQPNGTFTESVVLSVDPASALSLAVEERASLSFVAPAAVKADRDRMRVRATKHGFELVERK